MEGNLHTKVWEL